jgi:hypothetical protein
MISPRELMRKFRTSARGPRPEGTVVVRTVAAAFVLVSGCEMSAWAGDSLGSKLIAPRIADTSVSPLPETLAEDGKRAVETKITPVPIDGLNPVEKIIGPHPKLQPCPPTQNQATVPGKLAEKGVEESAEEGLEHLHSKFFHLIAKLTVPIVMLLDTYELFDAKDPPLPRIDGRDLPLFDKLYNKSTSQLETQTEFTPCE